MPDDPLTDLGVLLEQGRGRLSVRQAAKRAGFSEGRWRQIVTGVEKRGHGIRVPTNPSRRLVIAAAEAVGVDVNEALRRAGMPVDDPSLDVPGNQTSSRSVTATSGDDHGWIGETLALLTDAVRLIEEAHERLAQHNPSHRPDEDPVIDPAIEEARRRRNQREETAATQLGGRTARDGQEKAAGHGA